MSVREKRRAQRLPGRFKVAVREKLSTWSTSTEDLGPRGCRVELKRPLTPGTLVQLVFDMKDAEPLVVHGQVAWVRQAPGQAGITFLSFPREETPQAAPQTDRWMDRLIGAHRASSS